MQRTRLFVSRYNSWGVSHINILIYIIHLVQHIRLCISDCGGTSRSLVLSLACVPSHSQPGGVHTENHTGTLACLLKGYSEGECMRGRYILILLITKQKKD